MIDVVASEDPLVLFVGAGASSPPPSCFLRWGEFNDRLLACLCARLVDQGGDQAAADALLAVVRGRRDTTNFFASDFPAQLMEEGIGADYFEVWRSIGPAASGPVHRALAELAARGRVGAIVTTSFDRLVEDALQARGLTFRVFHDQVAFGAIEGALSDGVALPVIKVHGSIDDLPSLVDTLRQRLADRPQSLMRAVRTLLRTHAWLYLGFSGADFNHDPHYLGILDAAPEAKGFLFLNPEDRKVEPGVESLVAAYGAAKAATVAHGDLAAWLCATFGLRLPDAAPAASDERAAALVRVEEAIRGWVATLGDMTVVNVLCSMLRTLGLEADAHRLARSTWQSHRSVADTSGRSYARYSYNHGIALLEAGLIRSSILSSAALRNDAVGSQPVDPDAFDCLARSYAQGELLPAGGALAGLLAYRGEVARAMALAGEVTTAAAARGPTLELCDVAIGCAPVFDVIQSLGPAIQQFRECARITTNLGDQARRGAFCALLGRFLTYQGHLGEAEAFLDEADAISRRLTLLPLRLASRAARGLWLADGAASAPDAVGMLEDVVETIRSIDGDPLPALPAVIGRRGPFLSRVLLDLNRAAMLAGDLAAINRSLDALDELATGPFAGYSPHYYLAYAECLLLHGVGEGEKRKATDLIAKAREVGEATKNPWAAQQADNLGREVKE